jgi:hypothetical protein
MDKFNLLDCTLRDGGYVNNLEGEDAVFKNYTLFLYIK